MFICLIIEIGVFFLIVTRKFIIWESAIFYVHENVVFQLVIVMHTVNQMTRICLLCLYVDCRVQILFFINECKEIKNRTNRFTITWDKQTKKVIQYLDITWWNQNMIHTGLLHVCCLWSAQKECSIINAHFINWPQKLNVVFRFSKK